MSSDNATPMTIRAIPHTPTAAKTRFGPGWRESASIYCRRAGGTPRFTCLNCAVSDLPREHTGTADDIYYTDTHIVYRPTIFRSNHR